MARWWISAPALALTLALTAALATTACGGDDDDDAGGAATPSQRTLGSVTFNDHGTGDARGKAEFEVEADNFYFEPTFIRGDAGKELTLKVTNESKTKHNLSVAGSAVDTDIDAEGTATVKVTVPADGVVLFFCKYHAGSGMNGELLAGDAAPAAVTKSAGGTPGASGSPTTAGGVSDPY